MNLFGTFRAHSWNAFTPVTHDAILLGGYSSTRLDYLPPVVLVLHLLLSQLFLRLSTQIYSFGSLILESIESCDV